MEDTQKELERLDQELLDDTLEQMVNEKEPAFEDPQMPDMPQLQVAYHNYSNNYGKEEEAEAEAEEKPAKDVSKMKSDKLVVGLMITASVLCVGILAVLIYWLEAFLR